MEDINKIIKTIENHSKKIKFTESDHSYKFSNNNLTAVSNCISRFKKPFDSDTIASNYAKKRKLNTQDVLKQWETKKNNACDLGHKVHDFAEKYVNDRTLVPEIPHQEAVVKFFKDLPKTRIPIMTETTVYSEELGYAGTFDILFYDTEKKGLIPTDWKTNEDLYKNFRGQTMLVPFDFLLDMPLNAYCLQLSYYQIPLEDLGLNVIDREIVWLKPDGTYEVIKADDYTQHIRYYQSLVN